MPLRFRFRALAVVATFLTTITGLVGVGGNADAATTTKTPVMGPNLLTAQNLADWYWDHHGANDPQLPALNDSVKTLAQIFIDEGRKDGVRGDIAFVQSALETGWFAYKGSQIIPEANNYAGLYAYNGRGKITSCKNETSPSRCFKTPTIGVRTQIQLLRSYADATTKNMTGRLVSAPSDRIGLAPIWEYFGGNCPCGKLIWASADDYGLVIIKMYSTALVESGVNPACVPYAPGSNTSKTGNGYWVMTALGGVSAFGTAKNYGSAVNLKLAKPIIGAESRSDGLGYWLLGGDGGVFTFGKAKYYGSTGAKRLNKPIVGMERTPTNAGYWLVAGDGGIFSFGDAKYRGSTGARKLNKPIVGMERTVSGKGYWLYATDGGIFSFGDAKYYGALGGRQLSAPVVSMQRTVTGAGYRMLTADGHVYSFGDAQKGLGSIANCKNYGLSARLLSSPTGKGYWIATAAGSVIAFGDARRHGFPARLQSAVVGLPIANNK